MNLPADIRSQFENDPGKFLDFVQDAQEDPRKGTLLVQWGLATPRQEPSEIVFAPKGKQPSVKEKKPIQEAPEDASE